MVNHIPLFGNKSQNVYDCERVGLPNDCQYLPLFTGHVWNLHVVG